MSFTLIEQNPAIKKGPIAIKPYFNSNVQNMGLEKYGLSLYDGVHHEEQQHEQQSRHSQLSNP